MKEKLRNSLRRAEKYLSILNSREASGKIISSDYRWLLENCIILQEDMEIVEFKQLEVGMMQGTGRMLYSMKNLISVYPNYLTVGFPLDEKLVISAMKSNLFGYIKKIKDILENPQEIKNLNQLEKKYRWEMMKFDKKKIIEIVFVGFFSLSLLLLLEDSTFIYGFIINLISGLLLFILNFIDLVEKD